MYVAVTLTLTTETNFYNLATLLAAVEDLTLERNHAQELLIQAKSTNTGVVGVGDADIDANRRGYELTAGDSRTYRTGIQFSSLNLNSTVAGDKVNVEIITN